MDGKWTTPYCVIDNFFEKKDFEKIILVINKLNTPHLSGSKVITLSKRTKSIPKNLLELLLKLEKKYESKAKDILNVISPYKLKLHDSTRLTLAITPPGCEYPVHEDSIDKILTGVIYLKPESNFGTFIYKDQKDKKPFELDWKVNRGFFFSREHNKTWHSYKSETNSPRFTCVIVFSTNQLSKHLIQQVGIIKFPYYYFKKVIFSSFYHFYKRFISNLFSL